MVIGGWGGPAAMYRHLLPLVSAHHRICVYDRAGYGWSDAGPFPRSVDVQLNELERLLAAAGESGPLILLAHSYGGFLGQLYAHKHPNQVAGLILAESSINAEVYREAAGGEIAQTSQLYREFAFGSSLGLVELMQATVDPYAVELGGIFKDIRATLYAISRAKQFAAMASEFDNFTDAADRSTLDHDLGDLPLIVLSAERPDPQADASGRLMTALHDAGQRQLRGLSSNAMLVVATNSGHVITSERTDLIEKSIDDVIAMDARRQAPRLAALATN